MGNYEVHRPKITTKSSPAHGGEIMRVQLAAVKVDNKITYKCGCYAHGASLQSNFRLEMGKEVNNK